MTWWRRLLKAFASVGLGDFAQGLLNRKGHIAWHSGPSRCSRLGSTGEAEQRAPVQEGLHLVCWQRLQGHQLLFRLYSSEASQQYLPDSQIVCTVLVCTEFTALRARAYRAAELPCSALKGDAGQVAVRCPRFKLRRPCSAR